jgi:hypothetical protein
MENYFENVNQRDILEKTGRLGEVEVLIDSDHEKVRVFVHQIDDFMLKM